MCVKVDYVKEEDGKYYVKCHTTPGVVEMTVPYDLAKYAENGNVVIPQEYIDKKDLKVGDIIKTDKGKEFEVKSIYQSDIFEPVRLIVVYDKELKISYQLGDNTNIVEVIEHRDVKVVKLNYMFGVEYMSKEEAENLYPNGKMAIMDIATDKKHFYDIKIEEVYA